MIILKQSVRHIEHIKIIIIRRHMYINLITKYQKLQTKLVKFQEKKKVNSRNKVYP